MSEMLGKLPAAIQAKVPAGAKSGKIKVTTPNGSATSAPFPSTPGFSDRPT